MTCRLANHVQVRKESWGLLFYSSSKHKLRFVRSGELLYPRYFDGTWTPEQMVDDAAARQSKPVITLQPSFRKIVKYLVDSELIIDESR